MLAWNHTGVDKRDMDQTRHPRCPSISGGVGGRNRRAGPQPVGQSDNHGRGQQESEPVVHGVEHEVGRILPLSDHVHCVGAHDGTARAVLLDHERRDEPVQRDLHAGVSRRSCHPDALRAGRVGGGISHEAVLARVGRHGRNRHVGAGGRAPHLPFLASQSFISAISFSWAATMSWAILWSVGSFPNCSSTFAMSMAPW